MLTNSINNQVKINLALSKELRHKNLQIKIAKSNIALTLLACVIEPRIRQHRRYIFDKLHYNSEFLEHTSNKNIGNIDLDQSEIEQDSDADEETKDDGEIVSGILSKFHPPAEENESIINEEVVESSSSRPDKHRFNNEYHAESPTPPKAPLSIDILDEDSEDEDYINMALNSKGEKPLDNNISDNHPEDDDDENESNYSPWIYRAQNKNLSPFQNYKRQLIINTDSMESSNMKLLKATGIVLS